MALAPRHHPSSRTVRTRSLGVTPLTRCEDDWGFVSTDYVEDREGRYVVTESRVSLDSIAYAFLSGQSPESIAQAFPVLTLEQVYGAITFYLAHRETLDRYLETRREQFEAAREQARSSDPMFYQRLADIKKLSPLER
jgi:uncharacterized protein (DUF433 family)